MTSRRSGGTSTSTRVLVVDDHTVMRQGPITLPATQPNLEVVGDVANGREAILAADSTQLDVILMDLVMPGLNGLEATRQIRKDHPRTKVIMLTGFVVEDQIVMALEAGASGYVRKNTSIQEFVITIRSTHGGNNFFSEDINRQYDTAELVHRSQTNPQRTGLRVLTSRERKILQLVAEGLTNQELADELNISIKTVETHKSHIMDKLQARKRTDLIRIALRYKLVNMESAEEATENLEQENPD